MSLRSLPLIGYRTHSAEDTRSLWVPCGWYANMVVIPATSSAVLGLLLAGGDGLLPLSRL